MISIADAWRWYDATRKSLFRIRRLAAKHWGDLPWEGSLGRDDEFRLLEAVDVIQDGNLALDYFDDVAVLVLFSVFEAQVRSHLLAEVRSEVDAIRHPALRLAATDALTAIEDGSFFRVLEPFKSPELAGLVEEVNQVRRYRNWVAHGRRSARPPDVTPKNAFERLDRFLKALNVTATPKPG